MNWTARSSEVGAEQRPGKGSELERVRAHPIFATMWQNRERINPWYK